MKIINPHASVIISHPFCSLCFTKSVFRNAESGKSVKLFFLPFNMQYNLINSAFPLSFLAGWSVKGPNGLFVKWELLV